MTGARTPQVNRRAFDALGQVAYNASDIGVRSFVRAVDAADSLAELRHNATQALYSRAANASSSLADAAVDVVVGEAARLGLDLPAAVAASQAEEEAVAEADAVAQGGDAGGAPGGGVVLQGGGGEGGDGAEAAGMRADSVFEAYG
jgi:hypothetical protein